MPDRRFVPGPAAVDWGILAAVLVVVTTGGVRGRPALVEGALFVAAADGLYAFEPTDA